LVGCRGSAVFCAAVTYANAFAYSRSVVWFLVLIFDDVLLMFYIRLTPPQQRRTRPRARCYTPRVYRYAPLRCHMTACAALARGTYARHTTPPTLPAPILAFSPCSVWRFACPLGCRCGSAVGRVHVPTLVLARPPGGCTCLYDGVFIWFADRTVRDFVYSFGTAGVLGQQQSVFAIRLDALRGSLTDGGSYGWTVAAPATLRAWFSLPHHSYDVYHCAYRPPTSPPLFCSSCLASLSHLRATPHYASTAFCWFSAYRSRRYAFRHLPTCRIMGCLAVSLTTL